VSEQQVPSQPRRRRGRRRAVAISVAAALAVLVCCGGRWNSSASLPRGLYLEIPRGWLAGPPARGDLVVACAPPAAAEMARRRGYLGAGLCAAGAAGGAAAMGKVVLAVAGDVVGVGASGLEVNGRRVAGSRALRCDGAGRPLAPHAPGRFRVVAGEVWLFAPYHPRSFDSRYFGAVAVAAIRGWLVPVAIVDDDRFPGFRIHRFRWSVVR
jgi:conjugative transfer signal peptidase TraF